MANPLELMNRASYRPRAGVTYMPPVRIPARPNVVRPPVVRGTSDDPRLTAQRWLTPDFEAIANYQPPAPQQQQSGGNGLGGLGWVVGKVGQGALGALSVLDYPRAAVTATVREALDTAPVEALNKALAALPGVEYSPIQSSDPGWDWDTLWQNIKERKGFGETIVEPAMGEEGTDRNIWARRVLGFGGDVATDPFSYMTVGARATPGLQARSTYLNELLGAQKAATAEREALDAAMEAIPSPANFRRPGAAERVAARQAEAWQAAAAARQRELALGGEQALQQIGRQGVNIANPQQLAAMGLQPSAVRFGGAAIPGTEAIASAFGRATGPLKGRLSESALARGTRKLTTRTGYFGQDLRPALERIIAGETGESIEPAIRSVALNQSARRIGNTFRSAAQRELRRFNEEIKNLDSATRASLIRQAEEEGVENAMTTLAPRMRQIAADLGVEIPELQGMQYAMPHVFSREAYNWLNKLRRGQDPRFTRIRTALGLTPEDLMEEGGFLQKRILRPDADGNPMQLKIGDQTITIERGSISELEDKLGGFLRQSGFEGKLYETDPVEAWRRYINATSRDVAKRKASRDAARAGYPGLFIDPGKPAAFDPYEWRDLPPVEIEGEQVARQMIAERGVAPPEDTQFYEYKPKEQKRLRRDLGTRRQAGKQQRQLVSEFQDVATEARETAAAQMDDLTRTMWSEGVQAQRAAAADVERQARATVRDVRAQYSELIDQRRTLQRQVDDANAEIRRLQRQIGGFTSGAARRTKARSKQFLDDLRQQLDIAVAKRDKLAREVESTVQRARQLATDAEGRVFTEMQRRRRTFRQSLQDRVLEAERDLGDIEGRAESHIKAQRGKNWVSRQEFNQLRDEITDDTIAEYEQLVAREADLRNQRARYQADAADAENNARNLRASAKSRNVGDDARRSMEAEAAEWERTMNEARFMDASLETMQQNLRAEIKRSDLTRKISRMRQYQQQQRDIAKWRLGEGDEAVSVQAARAQYADAMRELDRWDADEALMRTQQPPAAALTEAEQTELAAAREVLSQDKSRRFITRRERLRNLQRVDPRLIPEDVRAAQVEKLTKERAELERWIAARPELAERVTKAEKTLRRLEDKLTKAAPEGPPRHEKALLFEREAMQQLQEALQAERTVANVEARGAQQLDVAERNIAQAMGELGQAERGVLRTTQPEVDAAVQRLAAEDAQQLYANRARLEAIDAELADLRGKRTSPKRRATQEALQTEHAELRQWFSDNADLAERVRADEATVAAGPQGVRQGATAQIAFEEAAATRPRIEATQEAIGQQRQQVDEFRQEMDQIDDEIGGAVRSYLTARQDQTAARARHDEIKANLAPLDRPRSAADILEGKRQGRPTGTGLEQVLAREATPYEVQPLKRTADDLDAVIRANPTGDDDLMNRAEAVLHSVEQTLTRATMEGDIPAHQVNKILRAARENRLQPVLKAQLKGAYTMLWEQGDVIVARDLQSMYFGAVRALDSKLFGRTFTAMTDFFKTYATLSPGFHIRNALSAIFMNASEDVSLHTQRRALQWWRQYVNAEDPTAWLERLRVRNPRVYNAFEATFASGAGGQFLETGVSELRSGRARFTEKLFANRATRLSQRWGQDWVEGPVRLALGLDSTVRHGMNTSQALDRITRVHFDYSQVSQFDEKMKRIVPFWTFMSRNIPLQFTQMWTKPKMYLRFQSFARNFSVEPPEFMPEYISQQGGFDTGVRTPEGLPLSAGGMPVVAAFDLPHLRLQEDIRRTAAALSGENTGQILSDVNPWFTAPFEYALGKDFYTGKSYGPTDVSKASGLGVPLAMLLSPVGGGEHGPGGWYLDDKTMNLIRSINPIMERTSRLTPGLWSESKGGQDRQLESYLRFLGAPVRTISEAQMQSEAARRYYDARDAARHAQAVGG